MSVICPNSIVPSLRCWKTAVSFSFNSKSQEWRISSVIYTICIFVYLGNFDDRPFLTDLNENLYLYSSLWKNVINDKKGKKNERICTCAFTDLLQRGLCGEIYCCQCKFNQIGWILAAFSLCSRTSSIRKGTLTYPEGCTFSKIKTTKEQVERRKQVPIILTGQSIYHPLWPSCKSWQGLAPKLPRTQSENK